MSGVKPYVEGQTGSLSDVIERGPELAPITPAGPGGFAPDPTWSQMFHAAQPAARRSTIIPDETKLLNVYTPIVDALGLPPSENPARFYDADPNTLAVTGALGQPSSLATVAQQGESAPFGGQRLATRQLQENLIVEQIKARRAKDPNALPGIPDTIEGIHALAEEQEAKARAAGAAVLARGSTFGRATAGLAAGGVQSALHDPSFLPSMVLGGGTATGVLQAVGRDALINGLFATVYAPADIYRSVAEDHEPLTTALGNAATNVVSAATIGAAFGATIHLATAHVPPALFKVMPESVQTRWAGRMRVGEGKDAPLLKDVLGDMNNRELAGFARSTIGARMTPDEKAAANVLERSQELGEASPFEAGPVGDAAHNANLATSLKSIIDGAPRESPKADLLTSSSPLGLRPPRPVAAPIAANFEAQWHAIVGNEGGTGSHGEFLTSPKGAIGPAQVMPGTAPYAAKLAGLPWDEVRYRSDPAYNQALGRAYYAEQLQTFGDPDMAAAAYNAGPGSAARGTGLRGAMRRAAEHGEPGNWETYLPHETQLYVENFRKRTGGAAAAEPTIAGAGGDDELAALQRSADDAEAQAIELGRDRSHADVTGGDRADVVDVPVLKREMFGSDEQWADAQAAFHQSLNGPEEAAGAPLSAETPSGPPELAPELATGSPGAPGAVSNTVDARLQTVADRGDFPIDHLRTNYATWAARDGEAEALRLLDAKERELGIPPAPLTRTELEALRPADNNRDALWLAGHNIVTAAELGQEPKGAWGVRNRDTGELVTWSAKKGHAEQLRGEQWDPERLDIERLSPQNVTAELRDRLATQRATAAAADVRIDDPALKDFEPGAAGPKDQVGSLEHDVRMAANDPSTAKRVYQIEDAGKPRTLIDILDELDADAAAAAALRACAGAAA